jgi:hypothetical protein
MQPFFVVLLAILCYADRLACGSDHLDRCTARQTFTLFFSCNVVRFILSFSLCAHNVLDVMFAWIFSSRQGMGRRASWASLCIFLSERRLGACA